MAQIARVILQFSFLFLPFCVLAQDNAQPELQFIRNQVAILTSPSMQGRGYVNDGRMRAAAFLQRKFVELGLKPVTQDKLLIQGYSFPVNTFPDKMRLVVNDKELKPGADYLVDAASVSFSAEGLKVKRVDMVTMIDPKKLKQMLRAADDQYVYCLTNTDSFCHALQIKEGEFVRELPTGCYIIPEKSKLTWDVATDTILATVFYVREDALPQALATVSADVNAVFVPKSRNENITACVPGQVKDTFIAFTAHYDHLGMMGDSAMFPGASDNASGVAMMLYLASYFAVHPQHYSILFIAFSGEEPGLLGSQFFVEHPLVPLASIKFLTNVDIMGDATDGVTVVNATEFPAQFDLLKIINEQYHYIPAIKSRGKARNSDHYYFTEAGVPSFFFYSNGGKGYYHDVFDTANELTLNHIDGVAKLLIEFVRNLN